MAEDTFALKAVALVGAGVGLLGFLKSKETQELLLKQNLELEEMRKRVAAADAYQEQGQQVFLLMRQQLQVYFRTAYEYRDFILKDLQVNLPTVNLNESLADFCKRHEIDLQGGVGEDFAGLSVARVP